MHNVNYLTKRITELRKKVNECKSSVVEADDDIQKSWRLVELNETPAIILAQYEFKKAQYQ